MSENKNLIDPFGGDTKESLQEDIKVWNEIFTVCPAFADSVIKIYKEKSISGVSNINTSEMTVNLNKMLCDGILYAIKKAGVDSEIPEDKLKLLVDGKADRRLIEGLCHAYGLVPMMSVYDIDLEQDAWEANIYTSKEAK